MAGLHVPLLTLRNRPRGRSRIARGRHGSLLLCRTTLAFATPRRLSRRYQAPPTRTTSPRPVPSPPPPSFLPPPHSLLLRPPTRTFAPRPVPSPPTRIVS